MSKSWTPGEYFRKTFHKGMGEPEFTGLLYHFGSLEVHYLPHDMDKILFPRGEQRQFENKAIEKEII